MTKSAIRVENLSKCFQLGDSPLAYQTLTETVKRGFKKGLSKVNALLRPGSTPTDNVFWAVKNVSFDVKPGEVMGVIGRNGAGKSTLLKILSRVTMPTEGHIEFRGRMGSLLEVGTGFHPELTGRENIWLAGSILGMRRREIQAKYDKIIEFAEIGEHLDTPVKRFSSGQYVRLAFSVAAYLEPEILIVDEVLAVGDATFQRRCIDRMAELARQGRTILFVSHNMQLIPQLCHRAVFLKNGEVQCIDNATSVTQTYMDQLLKDSRIGDLRDKHRTGDGRAIFSRAQVTNSDGQPISVFVTENDLIIRMEVDAKETLPDVTMSVIVQSLHGTRVISSWTKEAGFAMGLEQGTQTVECRMKNVRIRPGQTMLLNLWMATANGVLVDAVDNAVVMDVIGDDRHTHLSTSQDHGIIVYDHEWCRV